MNSQRRIDKMIKRHKGVHKVPGILITGMKDMSTIGVHIDTLFMRTVNITPCMRTTINDQATFADLS
jgi:hypothetical protein